MDEREFELRLCAHLEAEGHLVARQLGAGVVRPAGRIVDVVLVTPGPQFDVRTTLTAEGIPALSVAADVGAGRARFWKDAGRPLDVHPDRARAAIDRAIAVGFLEVERRNGRRYVRQATRYPDWVSEITAIENKPTLAAPGDLADQLRTDVSLALVDRVVLATASHVTRAHLNRLPDPVGVWRFDPVAGKRTVVREPERLPVAEPGIELIERHPGRDDVSVADADAKVVARIRLAERAYGKGWRPRELSGCRHGGRASIHGTDGVPGCSHFDRPVDPAVDCGQACPAFEPADPTPFDRSAARDRGSPWVANPSGLAREQGSLDRYVVGDGRER